MRANEENNITYQLIENGAIELLNYLRVEFTDIEDYERETPNLLQYYCDMVTNYIAYYNEETRTICHINALDIKIDATDDYSYVTVNTLKLIPDTDSSIDVKTFVANSMDEFSKLFTKKVVSGMIIPYLTTDNNYELSEEIELLLYKAYVVKSIVVILADIRSMAKRLDIREDVYNESIICLSVCYATWWRNIIDTLSLNYHTKFKDKIFSVRPKIYLAKDYCIKIDNGELVEVKLNE